MQPTPKPCCFMRDKINYKNKFVGVDMQVLLALAG
jgi:hypothetical protein